jgi:SAM-dependent methyltransferase
MDKIKLNLGCSDDLKPGYINIDRYGGEPTHFLNLSDACFHMVEFRDDVVYAGDISMRLPFLDGEVDEIYAKDVFEHVDNKDYPGNRGKIWVLNESYRVLKNGGLLEMFVPCVHMRDMSMNPGAFADPTHVSFWTHDDRYYFTEGWNNPQGERGRLGPAYGITCRFDIVKWDLVEYGLPHERRSKIHARLTAVK